MFRDILVDKFTINGLLLFVDRMESFTDWLFDGIRIENLDRVDPFRSGFYLNFFENNEVVGVGMERIPFVKYHPKKIQIKNILIKNAVYHNVFYIQQLQMDVTERPFNLIIENVEIVGGTKKWGCRGDFFFIRDVYLYNVLISKINIHDLNDQFTKDDISMSTDSLLPVTTQTSSTTKNSASASKNIKKPLNNYAIYTAFEFILSPVLN